MSNSTLSHLETTGYQPRAVIVPPFYPVYANDPDLAPSWTQWCGPEYVDPREHDTMPPDGIGRAVRAQFAHFYGTLHLLARSDSFTNRPSVRIHPIMEPCDVKQLSAEEYDRMMLEVEDRTVSIIKELVANPETRGNGARLVNSHWTNARLAHRIANVMRPVNGRLVVILHNTPDADGQEIVELARRDPTVKAAALSDWHIRGFARQGADVSHIYNIGSGLDIARAYPDNDFLPLVTTNDTPQHPVLESLKYLKKNFLLIIGDIGPHKGQRTARKIAEGAGMPLAEIGGLGAPNPRSPIDIAYDRENREMPGFIDCKGKTAQELIPLIQATLDTYGRLFLGGLIVGERTKQEFARFAAGAVFTSGLEYPYVPAYEIGASEPPINGAPTLACSDTSVAARTVSGSTGLIYHSIDEAIELVPQLLAISRRACADLARKMYAMREPTYALRQIDLRPPRLDHLSSQISAADLQTIQGESEL